jgi:hypothetical protein
MTRVVDQGEEASGFPCLIPCSVQALCIEKPWRDIEHAHDNAPSPRQSLSASSWSCSFSSSANRSPAVVPEQVARELHIRDGVRLRVQRDVDMASR